MQETAPASLPALGICLEEYEYPYPVRFLPVTSDLQPVAMAYMDIPPSTESNGMTVVLMHGKAFGCYYFRNVIEALAGSGYRVVAPDQIGWGKSSRNSVSAGCGPRGEQSATVTIPAGMSPDTGYMRIILETERLTLRQFTAHLGVYDRLDRLGT